MPWSALRGLGGSVLPKLKVPSFVDSPQEAFSFLRSDWGRWWYGAGRGDGAELWLVFKMNRKLNTKDLKNKQNPKLTETETGFILAFFK